MLSPQDANKIIDTFLSPRWSFVGSRKEKDELHRLANELRKASGQLRGDGGTPSPGPYLTFPVISDIHVRDWDTNSHRKLSAALEDLQQLNPSFDALVINGDLGDGLPGDYAKLSEILAGKPHPGSVFYTIGNHEYYKAYYNAQGAWAPQTFPNGETDRASKERFLRFAGLPHVYYDRWIKGCHFIFLGSEIYKQTDPSVQEDAYLSPSQLNWLETKLKENYTPRRPIFVFLHQPLPNTVSGTGSARGVVQHETLRRILSAYPEVIFFTGHTHVGLRSPGNMVRGAFTMINSSTVYQPSGGGDRSEGLVVEVYGDRVAIRGREFITGQWVAEAQYMINL